MMEQVEFDDQRKAEALQFGITLMLNAAGGAEGMPLHTILMVVKDVMISTIMGTCKPELHDEVVDKICESVKRALAEIRLTENKPRGSA